MKNSLSASESIGFFVASHFGWEAGYFLLWRLYPRTLLVLHVLLIGLVCFVARIPNEPKVPQQSQGNQPTGATIASSVTAGQFGADVRFPKTGKPLPIRVGFRDAFAGHGKVIKVWGNPDCPTFPMMLEITDSVQTVRYEVEVHAGRQIEIGWLEFKRNGLKFDVKSGQRVVISAKGYDAMVVVVP